MSKISDQELISMLRGASQGTWAVASNENFEFHIYRRDTSPIKYVIDKVPETTSNYDLRLMAIARELAEEVLRLRQTQRMLFDKGVRSDD